MATGTGADPKPAEPEIPRPPSKEEVEAISRDQALITDEWTGEGPVPPPPEPGEA